MGNAIQSATIFAVSLATMFSVRLLYAQNGRAVQKYAPIHVSVDEVDKHLLLVGRLKKPLGTLMTITGKWSYPKGTVKDYSLRFTVDLVDGRKLDRPVEFNVAQLRVLTKNRDSAIPPYERHRELVGKEWTIRGFETGSIELIPEDYFNETPPYAVPYYFRPFTSKITGVLQPSTVVRPPNK